MRNFLGLVVISAFAVSSTFGGKCESLFSQKEFWGDVRQGHLEFQIPESTTKWSVDIIFDKPVHTLNAWDGANGKCTPSKNKCTFTNASWNAHKNAGNIRLGFETRFQHSTTPPKFKKIVFKYDDKYIVVCGDDSGSGSNSGNGNGNNGGATNPPATEAPPANPTTANPDAAT